MPAAHSALACSGCGVQYEPPAAAEHDPAMPARVPRLLPCGHSVCTGCASDTADVVLPLHSMSAAPGRAPTEVRVPAVQCPCGCDAVPLGPKGVEELPVDVALAEAAAEGGEPEEERVCDECEESAATLWCDTCQSEFCETCFATVHAPRVMQKHKAVPLSEKPPPADMCPAHARQERTMYCTNCTAKVCALCCDSRFGGKHVGEDHNVIPLEDAASAAVARLKAELLKLAQRKQRLGAAAQRVSATLAGVPPSHAAAVDSIRAQFADLRRQVNEALDTREAELCRETENVANAKAERLRIRVREIGHALSRVARACSVSDAKLRGSTLDVLDAQATFARTLGDAIRAADASEAVANEQEVETAGVPVQFDSVMTRDVCARVLGHGVVGKGDGPRISTVTATGEGPKQVGLSEEEEKKVKQRLGWGRSGRRGSDRSLSQMRRASFRSDAGRPEMTRTLPMPAVTTQGEQRGNGSGVRHLLGRRASAPAGMLGSYSVDSHTLDEDAPVGLHALRSALVSVP
eukprot:TRINITY_DN2800_c3_g1_i1.p1 TRINITY_DN2800_c3_g1~~TRINITY_DN2800_c3_g1_i1.p1  ORF type:complete len:539 (+),score=105.38 TRINITY_DN2800_c3_g1_i1:60-1619(+)